MQCRRRSFAKLPPRKVAKSQACNYLCRAPPLGLVSKVDEGGRERGREGAYIVDQNRHDRTFSVRREISCSRGGDAEPSPPLLNEEVLIASYQNHSVQRS